MEFDAVRIRQSDNFSFKVYELSKRNKNLENIEVLSSCKRCIVKIWKFGEEAANPNRVTVNLPIAQRFKLQTFTEPTSDT